MSNAENASSPPSPEPGPDETASLSPGAPPPEPSTLAPSAAPSPGNGPATCPVVPGYQILGELGRGGMGVVYKAKQDGLDRLVALKMILAGVHAGADQLARFRAEARAVAQLHHANVVQIYQVGDHEGKPFLALEFVEGGSLADALRAGPWPAARAAALVEKLARAMHAIHVKGIVHRDLKPANILLGPQDEPKITDFGLAKHLESGATGPTASNAVLGTPSYMAPEQAGGRNREVGPATDVYALGAILYELLTGRPPFRADTALDTLMRVASDEPTPPRQVCPALPGELELICLKCLAKQPGERYPTAEALADDLRCFREGEPVSVRPPSARRRFARWRAKHPGTTVALFLAAAFWCVPMLVTGLGGNLLALPLFAVVLFWFVHPTRRSFGYGAAGLALLALLSYAVTRNVQALAVMAGLWVLPAVLMGLVGRAVAWAMTREVVATTLGAYFGGVAGSVVICPGLFFVLFLSFGQENTHRIMEFNKGIEGKSEAEIKEFFQEFDYVAPIVAGVTWLVVSSLGSMSLGAVIGGMTSGRKMTEREASPGPMSP